MTTACPHRYLSYATWRLEVLTRLCSPDLQGALSSRNYHRKKQSKSSQSRCRHLHTSPILSAPKKPKSRPGKRGEPDTSSRRDGLRPTSKGNSFEAKPENVSASDAGRRLGRDNGRNTRTVPIHYVGNEKLWRRVVTETDNNSQPAQLYTNRWNPYTERGREDLMSMIADLEALTKDSLSQPKGRKLSKHGTQMLESPVERRLRLVKRAKDSPKYENIDHRLENNLWAKILASPIRQCSATKARFPRDLMTSWGVIQNPTTQQDYLMPIELSNLKAFTEDMAVDTDPSQPVKKPSRPKDIDGERIYVQSDKFLLHSISDAVIKIDTGHSERHTNSAMLTSLLIPYRWRHKLEMATAFRRTHRTVNEETGNVEPASEEWKKDVPALKGLQWQDNVWERMQTMMNERVLIALAGVANSNATYKGIRARRVLTMDVPEQGLLRLHGLALVPEDRGEKPSGYSSYQPLLENKLDLISDRDDISARFDDQSHEMEGADLMSNPADVLSSNESEASLDSDTKSEHVQSAEHVQSRLHNTADAQDVLSSNESESSLDSDTKSEHTQFRPYSSADPPDLVSKSQEEKKTTESGEDFWNLHSSGPAADSNDAVSWLHGSFFLHFGTPAQYVQRAEDWHQIRSSNAPGPFKKSLLPPTIIIDDHIRIPVFNLTTMLGPAYDSRLKDMKSDYGILDYRFWESYNRDKQDFFATKAEAEAAKANDLDPLKMMESFKQYYEDTAPALSEEAVHNREYLVLVKSTARQSSEFIHEIWQLWRYIGGRTGLWLDGVEHGRKNNFHWCFSVGEKSAKSKQNQDQDDLEDKGIEEVALTDEETTNAEGEK